MSRQVFVTGMLRSGTTLTQILLTNHRQAWVAYQPFHQLYVDVKQRYLDECGFEVSPPLEDGAPGSPDPGLFVDWLERHRFGDADAQALARRASTGKGGSMSMFSDRLSAMPGDFPTLRQSLHASMARCLDIQPRQVMGSKEILCEEYLPNLIRSGTHCVVVIRDPRAVIASANHGRYREAVGDRYPLLMLIRLWRKSANYWLDFHDHPMVHAVRYEDLIQSTDAVLSKLADWLDISRFPPGMANVPLNDHLGLPWQGNSSFGDRTSVDNSSISQWRDLLDEDEIRFIEACTFAERMRLGYDSPATPNPGDILDFDEARADVRESYLARHAIDGSAKALESRRLEISLAAVSPDCR